MKKLPFRGPVDVASCDHFEHGTFSVTNLVAVVRVQNSSQGRDKRVAIIRMGQDAAPKLRNTWSGLLLNQEPHTLLTALRAPEKSPLLERAYPYGDDHDFARVFRGVGQQTAE